MIYRTPPEVTVQIRACDLALLAEYLRTQVESSSPMAGWLHWHAQVLEEALVRKFGVIKAQHHLEQAGGTLAESWEVDGDPFGEREAENQ